MRNPLLLSGCAAVALLATACTNVFIEDPPGMQTRYSYYRGELDYATRNGAIKTTVLGNPFGQSKQAFDSHVLGLMKNQNRGVPAEFVPADSHRTDPVFHVVVGFNLPINTSPQWLCKQPANLPTQPASGNLRMIAAFCQGDALQSDSAGLARGVTGPNDPKFATLVRGVTNAMVPIDIDEESDKSDTIL